MIPMNLVDTWEGRLAEVFDRFSSGTFRYGDHDCATFVLEAERAMYGWSPLKKFVPTEREESQLVAQFPPERLANLYPWIFATAGYFPVQTPTTGDIAIFEFKRLRFPYAFGVVDFNPLRVMTLGRENLRLRSIDDSAIKGFYRCIPTVEAI